MLTLLGLPPWEGLHPVVVHFAVALLLVVPVFLLLGIFWRRQREGLWLGAFLLMIIGTASVLLAVETGEASVEGGATQSTQWTEAVDATFDAHHEAAELARTVFVVLTGVFAALGAIHRWGAKFLGKSFSERWIVTAGIAFLIVYLGACGLLVRAGRLGGELVHSFGVRAPMGTHSAVSAPEQAGDHKTGAGKSDEDKGDNHDHTHSHSQ